jgi:hypothetical protein
VPEGPVGREKQTHRAEFAMAGHHRQQASGLCSPEASPAEPISIVRRIADLLFQVILEIRAGGFERHSKSLFRFALLVNLPRK